MFGFICYIEDERGEEACYEEMYNTKEQMFTALQAAKNDLSMTKEPVLFVTYDEQEIKKYF